ncbi:MAG: cytochrome c oxidase subunit 3, partial [Planctomycetia bacterium]
ATWPPHEAVVRTELGGLNTFILLASSVTVILARRSLAAGRVRSCLTQLTFTILLGLAFLGVKTFEYSEKINHHLLPFEAELRHGATYGLWSSWYFVLTGVHVVHLVAGLIVWSWVLSLGLLGKLSSKRVGLVEVCGLYWHFVELVWIVLFALIYLV